MSGLLGIAVGLLLGARTYEAETVLLYKPATDAKNLYAVPSVTTYADMVKIRCSLEDLSRRLSLDATLQKLDAACDVSVEKNSDLMIIHARWKSADTASSMANTLRDIFLESQSKVRKSEASKQVRDLEARLEAVGRRLKDADRALHDFTLANKVVNLGKEAEKYLDELTSIDLLYENAQVEKRSIEMKAASLDALQADLKRRVAEQKPGLTDDPQKVYELNIRLERLRDAIHEDQYIRSAAAELAQREVDLAQAKKLFEKGVISELEYEKAKNAYEKQKAIAVDTDKIKQWRAEIDKLHETVLPTDNLTSAPVFREVMLKAFDIQLERAPVAEKVKYLETVRARVKEKLESLPKLQREYVDLSREVASREAEKQALDALLSQARRVFESETSDFGVVSEATPPAKPVRSTRTLLCLIVACAGTFLAFALAVGLELMDTSVKSGAEFALKLPLPLLGIIPEAGAGTIHPDGPGFAPAEPFRIAAQRIRSALPRKGARLLVVSAEHGEGRSVVMANLAASLGRQDERVLVIDGQLRAQEGNHALRSLIPASEGPLKGLGEYLSFQANEMKEVIWPTFLPGVECLPRGGTAVVPEFLGSNRMRELLEQVSEQYSLVLLDVLPTSSSADAEALAPLADGILLVVRSRQCRASRILRSVERLNATRTPLIGGLLNAVNSLYLETT